MCDNDQGQAPQKNEISFDAPRNPPYPGLMAKNPTTTASSLTVTDAHLTGIIARALQDYVSAHGPVRLQNASAAATYAVQRLTEQAAD